MTRFLSESLQAPEPYFSLHLRGLEAAHGNPRGDIKLSSSVIQETQNKLKQLSLDPLDTHPEELYRALNEKLKVDDARLTKRLRTLSATHISAEAEVVAGMAHALEHLPISKNCFALKPSVMKRLIKMQPPKKAMKQLGYRSLESMLKQEPLSAVMAAAVITEQPSWQKHLQERYKKLTPRDFEMRKLAVVHPNSRRWQELSTKTVGNAKHNLLTFPELGAIVLLPLPAAVPAGVVTASLALALHSLNEVRAGCTFLKLCQVRSDFGVMVQTVVAGDPRLEANLLDKNVSWQLVQRYYARMQHHFREELFEPHIKLEDLSWHSVERAMAYIEPSLKFWQGSSHLGVLHKGKPVSCNIIDAALNVCNAVKFENRIVGYFQKSLWHELQLQYLKPASVEQTVMSELRPQLAYEPATAI